MPRFARFFLLLTLVLSACAEPEKDPATVPDNGQKYRDAIATMCNVDEAVGAGADTDVLELADRRHEYLEGHVKHPDGIYFYTLFRTQGPKEQAEGLQKEAKDVGIKRCALADTLAVEGARP